MSQYVDRSATERIRQIRVRTLAATIEKPTGSSNDYDVWLAIKEGRAGRRVQPAGGGPALDIQGCCPGCPDTLTVTVLNLYSPPPPYDASYNIAYDLSWNAIPGASSYTVTITSGDPYTVLSTGPTTATLYFQWNSVGEVPLIVTANGSCAAPSEQTLFPCFLAGSLVQMADGSQKAIEDVLVGDEVVGAFGETNRVLALHRPLLGSAHMNRINDEHSTTAHHPHVSIDRGFYCSEPATVETSTYGREHDVINAYGVTVKRMLHGLRKGRVQKLTLGTALKTVEGSRLVRSLVLLEMPPETQLYNLVVGGSHTYHVDGYAVTGWPREDDFDYDSWFPKTN